MSAEERALAVANNLLDRFGIVTRDIVLAEGTPGGFSGLYAAFSSLEDVGSVRRGYFIEGMGGAQFALPGAVERLRRPEPATIVLSAVDPANPYGASVPWPSSEGKAERRSGASVCLVDGRPAAWLDSSGRRIVTFGVEDAVVVDAIHRLASVRSRVQIATIDGAEVLDHALGPELINAGFTSGYKGLALRGNVRPR
jgi:ATP-dependent Lhr-like helicase